MSIFLKICHCSKVDSLEMISSNFDNKYPPIELAINKVIVGGRTPDKVSPFRNVYEPLEFNIQKMVDKHCRRAGTADYSHLLGTFRTFFQKEVNTDRRFKRIYQTFLKDIAD